MKNTTFKKKALISSIAMLLVALVALGSATFAWFAANPNASAKGITLKTTASTGLVIKTDTDDAVWGHSAVLRAKTKSTADTPGVTDDAPFNLTPVSQKQSAPDTFYTVDADDASNYKTTSTPTTTTSGFYKENIYCRLSDGSDTTTGGAKKVYLRGVTITKAPNATMEGCIRVAIANGTTLLGTYTLSTGTANGVLTPDAGEFTNLAATGTNLSVDTGLTGLSATATDKTKYLTVYVYLDGQDNNCYSDFVGEVNAQQIISNIQVDLSLEPLT